jgi:hypothetical protein
LSLKGANSPPRGRKLRSTGTKAKTRIGQVRMPHADLERQLETYKRKLNEAREDLAEALEQQTATLEVLQVISSSPRNLQAVFQAMLENATRVCGAKFGVLWLPEGDGFRAVALHGLPPAFAEARRREPWVKTNPGTSLGRVAATKRTVQIADIRQEPAYINDPSRFAILELAGARTMLSVPILKDNELVGQFGIYRQEVRPFSEKQIELATSFANQVDNTRLLNELRQRTADLGEALEQQTATSEVLRVISSSPGELQRVFAAMLENATRICEAKFGFLFRYDAGAFNPMAMLNVPPALEDFMRQRGPYRPQPGLPLHRVLETKKIVHTIDQAAEEVQTPSAKLAGARTHLAVPMLKEGETGSSSPGELEITCSTCEVAVCCSSAILAYAAMPARPMPASSRATASTPRRSAELSLMTAVLATMGASARRPAHFVTARERRLLESGQEPGYRRCEKVRTLRRVGRR